MPKYRVIEYALVKITSEEMITDDPVAAYREYRQKVNLDQLLRNIVGTKLVNGVEFANYRDSAEVAEFNEAGDYMGSAVEFSDEELNNREDLL